MVGILGEDRGGQEASGETKGGRRLVMTFADVVHTGARVLATQVFPSELRSLSLIRSFVEKWAKEVGLGEEPTYRIKLSVSEACANAIEHPAQKSELTLGAWSSDDRFIVDVWHAGEFRLKSGEDQRHRGLGLPLMVASADEVSFACLPEGGTRVSLSVFLR